MFELDPNEVSKRFRIAMNILGVDQKGFSELLSVNQSTVSNYLNGRLPSAEIFARLAKVAEDRGEDQLNIYWLLFGQQPQIKQADFRVCEPQLKYGEIIVNLDDSGLKPEIQLQLSKAQIGLLKIISGLNDDNVGILATLAKHLEQNQKGK